MPDGKSGRLTRNDHRYLFLIPFLILRFGAPGKGANNILRKCASAYALHDGIPRIHDGGAHTIVDGVRHASGEVRSPYCTKAMHTGRGRRYISSLSRGCFSGMRAYDRRTARSSCTKARSMCHEGTVRMPEGRGWISALLPEGNPRIVTCRRSTRAPWSRASHDGGRCTGGGARSPDHRG